MSMMRLLSAGKSLVDAKSLTPTYRMRGKFHLPQFGPRKNPFAGPVKEKPGRVAAVAPLKTPVGKAQPHAVFATPKRTADLQPAEIASVASDAELNRVTSGDATSAETVSAAPLPLNKTRRMSLPPEQVSQTKKIPCVAPAENVGATGSSEKAREVKCAGGKPAVPGAWRKVWRVVAGWFKKMNAFAWAMDHQPKKKPAIPRFDRPAQGELSLDNIRVVRNDLCDSDLEMAPAKTFGGQTNSKPAPALAPSPENRKEETGKAETENLFSQTCST